MEGALFGIGLKNLLGIFILFLFLIVVLKVVSIKIEKTPAGVRDFIQTI